MSLATQNLFAKALLDLDQDVPAGLGAENLAQPGRRFDVHRNNRWSGLVGALASRFPVAEKIVGQAFFAAMAQAFVTRHPPTTPILLAYGDHFADFVASYHPAAGLDYLPDVVRLEAARSQAYHAADASPLEPAALAGRDPDRLAAIALAFHPSASVLRSAHPVLTIWAMNAGELELSPIEPWIGEDVLVVRPHLTVLVQRLPPGGAAFLTALMSGATLAVAVEAAQENTDDFDLAANLAGLLQSGAAIAIR